MCPSPRRHSLPVSHSSRPGRGRPLPPVSGSASPGHCANGVTGRGAADWSLHPHVSRFGELCALHASNSPLRTHTRRGQCRRGDRASVRVDVQGSGRPGSAESPRATFWGTNSAGPWGRPAFVRPDAPSREWEAPRLLQTHVGTASLMTNATCGDLCGVQQQVASQGSHWSALSAPAYHGAGEVAATWSDSATRQPSTGQTQVSAWWGGGQGGHGREGSWGAGWEEATPDAVQSSLGHGVLAKHSEWMARPRPQQATAGRGPGWCVPLWSPGPFHPDDCATQGEGPALPGPHSPAPCAGRSQPGLRGASPSSPYLYSWPLAGTQGQRTAAQPSCLRGEAHRPASSAVFLDIRASPHPERPWQAQPAVSGPPRPLTAVMPAGGGPLCDLCTTDRNSACSPHPHPGSGRPGTADGQSAQPCVDVPSAREPLGATGARPESPGEAEGQLQP